jgi:hypothetical protein
MLSTILLVVLILILIGALPTWGYSSGWGYGPGGAAHRCHRSRIDRSDLNQVAEKLGGGPQVSLTRRALPSLGTKQAGLR